MADEREEREATDAATPPVPGRDWLAIALLVFFLSLIGLVAALLVVPAIRG